jgi:signal peptidase I
MRPTLNPDSAGPSDWVLVEKLSVKLQRCYTRGEVVVLW